MELKVIKRNGIPKQLVALPSEDGGVLTGVVERVEHSEFPLVEKVGAGVLLLGVSKQSISRVEKNPAEKLERYLKPVPERPNSIKLIRGVKGIIFDALDSDSEPIRPETLVLNGFNEYAPSPKRFNPLFGPVGTDHLDR